MHPVSIPFRFTGIIALVTTILFVTTSIRAQENEVEYVPTTLSDTLTMLKGSGGNIAISAGEDGVYIIDDQVKPITAQLLQTTRRPIKSIADLVGFESRSHFSRSFSDFFGASPAEFRDIGPSA